LSLCLGFAGCGSDSSPGKEDGGANTGGKIATGGASSTGGGSTVTGGASSSGGTTPGTGGKAQGGAGSGGKSSGGTASTGGASSTGGKPAASGGTPGTDGGGADPCERTDLVWKTGSKTNYTSYPDPGSEECIKYNGCTWAGEFAACDGKKPESWVAAHNIVAAFPSFDTLKLHDLCLRPTKNKAKTIVVTVLDTCGDSDCGGCCTENKGSADQLIDVESYTNDRWGVSDGAIEWADLGPTKTAGCK
jgi:hypothetical protein